MSRIMNLPKIGVNMKDAIICEWYVKVGDEIQEGDLVFAAETDKATQEVESTDSGIVGKLLCDVGDCVNIYEPIMVLLEPGEKFSEDMVPGKAASEGEINEELKKPESKTIAKAPVSAETTKSGRIRISPLAKKLAKEKGIDIFSINPESPGKRIVKKDVIKAAEVGAASAVSAVTRAARIIPFSGMRKTIAARMLQSQQANAQTTHHVRVNMSEAVRLRESLKAADQKISYNDIIAFAVCKSLMEYPQVNSEYSEEGILQKDFVNLGIAVALEEGLIVPVIKDADLMSLSKLSAASKDVVERAKSGRLGADEYKNGSFTISNLGMFGLDDFVAIINPPESGILAIGKIERQPVVSGNEIEICPMMSITLSYDHRVVDGAPAAGFIVRVKQLLENPYLMI